MDVEALVWDTLGPELQEIVRLAEAEARQRGHRSLGDTHLALALTQHPAGQAAVRSAGVDLAAWRALLERDLPARDPLPAAAALPWTRTAHRILA